ncbi:Uncharacterized protein QTN25_006063 [Entamoeba marina]
MLFLFSLLLLNVLAEYDTCLNAKELTADDLDANSIVSVTGDTTAQSSFCHICYSNLMCPDNQYSVFYKFTLQRDIDVELSTCNDHTNFNTLINVLTECDSSKASVCAATNDDDAEDSTCVGGKSQVTFLAKKGVTYYVAVSGVTETDVGTFKLTLQRYFNPSYPYCTETYPVSFPGTIKGFLDTTMYVYNPSLTREGYGTWFSYTSPSNQLVFVDTCGDYTSSFDPMLTIYEGNNTLCEDVTLLASDSDSCGGMNPRIQLNVEAGKTYYILLEIENGDGGQYRINFRTNAAENTNCEGAIGITTLPFKKTLPMSNFVEESTACNTDKTVGMWYSIVGDGERYVIDTCSSNPSDQGSGYVTGIEMFPYCSTGAIGECLQSSYNTCGDDAFIDTILDDGVVYFIRATCETIDCYVTLKIDKIGNSSNSECIKPKIIAFFTGGDEYEDVDVNAANMEESPSGCDGTTITRTHGAWYAFVSVRAELMLINVIVTPKTPAYYSPVIELHEDCHMYSCLDYSSHNMFTFQFSHDLSNNYRLLYASVVSKNSETAEYGMFDFWAAYQPTSEGKSMSDPIVIESIPYTYVGYVDTSSPFISKCYLDTHNVEVTVNGAWFKYTHPADKTVTVNTCGPETHIDTALEVLRAGSTFDDRTCVFGNKDDMSPRCGVQAALNVYGLTSNTELYPVVISDPETTDNFGTFRMSMYIAEKPSNSVCDSPVPVESYPFEHYSYISLASPTILDCSLVDSAVSSLGTWYAFEAPDDGEVYILADDLCEMAASIAIFPEGSCVVDDGESKPVECYDDYTNENSPYGHRGAYAHFRLKKGDKRLLFVGSSDSSADGIIHFKMTFTADDSNDSGSSKNSFVLSEVFWVVSGVLVIVFAIVTAVIFVFLAWFTNRKNVNFGKL